MCRALLISLSVMSHLLPVRVMLHPPPLYRMTRLDARKPMSGIGDLEERRDQRLRHVLTG